jgi:hypothetical protein
MSYEEEKLRKALKKFLQKDERVFTATVIAVNEDECSLDVQTAEGAELYDVKLKALRNVKKGVMIIPATESTVQVCRTGEQEYLMIAADDVAKVLWMFEGSVLSLDSEGFQLKKDNDELKDIIRLIIEAVQETMVLYGKNPNFLKLQQALTKNQNFFK